MTNKKTFSFGANWMSYVPTITQASIESASKNIQSWLKPSDISDKRILDIGCGSGIHSLVFYRMGAKEVVSFDIDMNSVLATFYLRDKEGLPPNWKVMHGSVLDDAFLNTLGEKFDVVYSWGVLHHTGSMWQAAEKAGQMVRKGGLFWFTLYVKGPQYEHDLAMKKKYNASSRIGKTVMEYIWIGRLMRQRLLSRQNPFAWNQKKERGMDTYHDIIDWLGGLPYEVASAEEVIEFSRKRGFVLEKIKLAPEGSNNSYLFALP